MLIRIKFFVKLGPMPFNVPVCPERQCEIST